MPRVNAGGPAVPEEVGCGKVHTSMLDWQDCVPCRNLGRYTAYRGQPRFVPPVEPPKVEDKA